MSVARFIADQRTNYRVPHTVTCLLLGVSLAWFYKWRDRALGPAASSGLFTPQDRRRDTIDRAVKVMFTKKRGLHGSPRLHADLRDDGWEVSEKTVADSMLLEPGASAGLNLNVDRYRFTGPGWSWGREDSPLVFDTGAPGVPGVVVEEGEERARLETSAVRPEPFEVVRRRGCDLAPVDVTDPDQATYVASYVWPFDGERRRRLAAGIDVAREHPVTVDRAPASSWLAGQLSQIVADDVVTVVWQSITEQYWPAAETAAVHRSVERARARIPLVHVTMEGVPPLQSAGGYRIEAHGPELRVDGDLVARSHHHGPPVFLLTE